jgi:hypothetical protein
MLQHLTAPSTIHNDRFHRLAPYLNDRSVIGQKRVLAQRLERYVGEAGQSRAVGAAASGDADARGVCATPLAAACAIPSSVL